MNHNIDLIVSQYRLNVFFLQYFVFIFSNRAHTVVYNIHLYSPSCSFLFFFFISLSVSVDGYHSSRHWIHLMNEK